MNECNNGNLGCFDFGSDYNRWGCDGPYLPLTYQIYYGDKNQIVNPSPGPEPTPGDDKVRVEGDTLIIPSDFEVAYVSEDTLIIQNDNVNVNDVTLNFIN